MTPILAIRVDTRLELRRSRVADVSNASAAIQITTRGARVVRRVKVPCRSR